MNRGLFAIGASALAASASGLRAQENIVRGVAVPTRAVSAGGFPTHFVVGGQNSGNGPSAGLADMHFSVTVVSGAAPSDVLAYGPTGDAGGFGLCGIFTGDNGELLPGEIRGVDASLATPTGNPFTGTDGPLRVFAFTYLYTGPMDGRQVRLRVTGYARQFLGASGERGPWLPIEPVDIVLQAGEPCSIADVNLDGVVDSDDLADFFNAFYAGCP